MAYVKVDVFALFMSYKSAEVTAYDAMPDSLVCFFKTAFHVVGNQLLTVSMIKCMLCIFNSHLSHVSIHIAEFNDGFT